MPIPDFQSLMLPVLRSLDDGGIHTYAEIAETLAKQLELTEAEVAEFLPSGKQRRFDNRIRWARTYLEKARLVESPRRGAFSITERGRELLAGNPSKIDMRSLEAFPEYRAFRALEDVGDPPSAGTTPLPSATAATVPSALTPEEQIDRAMKKIEADVIAQIKQKLDTQSPAFLEKLVVELLQKMGYGGQVPGAGTVIGGTGDGGIDGVIKKDKLGFEYVYIQAKHWEANVGRPDVQKFAGSLDGVKGRHGVMVTTSAFSPDAQRYVDQIDKKIILIDGERLARLMIEHGVGVETQTIDIVKKIDSDYFDGG